jgi:uncharacterized protein (TIGR02246 family)
MMHRTKFLLTFLLCGWAYQSALAQDSLAEQWARLWGAKKLGAVMQLYAPDAAFLPAIGRRWEGVETIRRNFAGLLAHYNPHIVLRSIRHAASGNLGYESGAYDETITPVNGREPIAAKGSYLFVYQKQGDGGWKILEQTWTSEGPPRKL